MDLAFFGRVLVTYCFGLGLAAGGSIGCYRAAIGATDRLWWGRLDGVAAALDVEDSDRALQVLWLIMGAMMVLVGGAYLTLITLGLVGYL